MCARTAELWGQGGDRGQALHVRPSLQKALERPLSRVRGSDAVGSEGGWGRARMQKGQNLGRRKEKL